MPIYWVLMSFLMINHPFLVDDFKFSTQAGCLLALNKMGPTVTALDVKCVKQQEPNSK